jgi:gliding motility-associated-like protein
VLQRKNALLLLFLLCGFSSAFATHYRAGEIIYTVTGPLTYEASIITYTKFTGSSASADRDSVTIDWGDGSQTLLARSNGPIIGGLHKGEVIFDDVRKNVYTGTHQYAGSRPYYVISLLDPNRIDNIININAGGSVNTPFYIEDTLRFYDYASLGANNSPVLLNPPIDYANVNDTFYHNPNAYDADGDSLFFTLIPPKQSGFSNVPGYQYPNQIVPGANNRFFLNSRTGEIIWATPQHVGIYNIAFLVYEYRNGRLLGTLERDMQIIVNDYPNDPPVIDDVHDTCILAGTALGVFVTAHDPQLSQTVSLTGSGGPMQVSISPARFDSVVGNPVTGTFTWQTQCEHIRSQFYTVVFRASDNFASGSTSVPLVDLETWLIRVIAPPPLNLLATPFGNQITVTWDNPYSCGSVPNFRGFSVWRKVGSNPFIPDSCETGLAGRGYTKIADNLTTFRYVDNDVVAGQVYCYRALAHFSQLSPSGLVQYDNAESIPSNESCAELKKDKPIITHVSVTATDASNGKIFIDWTNPRIPDLDTVQNPGPYKYELMREQGYPGTGTKSIIKTWNSPTFGALLLDTFYNDSLLNTVDFPYSYQIRFKAQSDTIVGSSAEASSVYLSVHPSDKRNELSWKEVVPWTNFYYQIYRLNRGSGLYEMIDSSEFSPYTDTGLVNDTNYCYYVQSKGRYSSVGFIDPILNNSETACGTPRDTIAPCPPPLAITNDCDKIKNSEWSNEHWKNYLTWNVPPDSCGKDIRRYRIYFREPLSSVFVLIDSSGGKFDTSYVHNLAQSNFGLAGCYRVTSVDTTGNESDTAFSVCIDNCPYYELPNVFTPNGDGSNDLFKPFPYRFVSRINMKIFDRWGNQVFETTNPDILWDGKDLKTGKPLSEGVYFYSGSYFEEHISGEIERPLPPNKNGGGYIHLMRNN